MEFLSADHRALVAGRRLISVWIVATLGLLLTVVGARFSGLYMPYWGVNPNESALGAAAGILGRDLVSSVSKGWPLALFMVPLYIFTFRYEYAARSFGWVIFGVAYGQYAFGGYVRHGDYSGMVMVAYGPVCALLSETVHLKFWRGVSWLHSQKIGAK